jgi:hypothetical protein
MTSRRRRLTPDQLRMHRTLGRISRAIGDQINLVIPAWNPNSYVPMKRTDFPEAVRDLIEKGRFLIFMCNIGSPSRNDLKLDFSECELAPEPSPELVEAFSQNY